MPATINTKSQFGKDYISNVDSYIMLVFLVYGLISQYLFLTVLGGLTFIVILRNLWKPYTPPVLLYFIMFHWLQVFASILYADFLGKSIDRLFSSSDTQFLFFMTFLQIIVISLSLQYYGKSSKVSISSRNELVSASRKLNVQKVIVGFIVTFITINLLTILGKNNSFVSQLVNIISIFKYFFTALLLFLVFLRNNSHNWLIIIILITDFILSFVSFFSDFKTILIILVIVYLTINPLIKRSVAFKTIPIITTIVVFFTFWSQVKVSYREFLNKGVGQQVVLVSEKDALLYLYDNFNEFSIESFKDGLTILLSRIQYMERYSEVYYRVPKEIPHTRGSELQESLEFIFIPRILNKNKGVNDASLKTSLYTGKKFASREDGVSISMGYFCDLFIDFGLYLMILPLLLITAFIGLLYKYLMNFGYSFNSIYTYSLIIGVFMQFGRFETDIVAFLGALRNTAFFIVIFIWFNKFLHRYITE